MKVKECVENPKKLNKNYLELIELSSSCENNLEEIAKKINFFIKESQHSF